VLFLCNLFVVFGFGALRTSARQTAVTWSVMVIGLIGLFLWTDKPIALPHGNYLERLATMLVFALTIGRCMFLGIFSSSMQQSLYQNGLKLHEAYGRIEELAELDELTGAYNRRCIMRMLDEEIARAGRSGLPCSVALIDLDWFKRINDAYGHPIGDEVLRTFAITMFANIRSVDRFGRYGGEEFLLILPELSEHAATRALERLRVIIAELDWSAFSPGMKVAISAGVATLRPNEGPDTLLARADNALYAAKARGRNGVGAARIGPQPVARQLELLREVECWSSCQRRQQRCECANAGVSVDYGLVARQRQPVQYHLRQTLRLLRVRLEERGHVDLKRHAKQRLVICPALASRRFALRPRCDV